MNACVQVAEGRRLLLVETAEGLEACRRGWPTVRPQDVSVHLGSDPGEGEGDRAIEDPGTPARSGGQQAYGPQRDGLLCHRSRTIESGDIRRDLEPFDLLRALIGIAHVASSPDWRQSATRLVDISGSHRGRRPRL